MLSGGCRFYFVVLRSDARFVYLALTKENSPVDPKPAFRQSEIAAALV
jgi:hypothetical protein